MHVHVHGKLAYIGGILSVTCACTRRFKLKLLALQRSSDRLKGLDSKVLKLIHLSEKCVSYGLLHMCICTTRMHSFANKWRAMQNGQTVSPLTAGQDTTFGFDKFILSIALPSILKDEMYRIPWAT